MSYNQPHFGVNNFDTIFSLEICHALLKIIMINYNSNIE